MALKAKDDDSDKNGAPFEFHIEENASPVIQEHFAIQGIFLKTLRSLDREKYKQHLIPITIVDSGSPRQTGRSTLTVVVTDKNDNRMKTGNSGILVYNFKSDDPDTFIGRVYVDDPDDDLPSKRFAWKGPAHPNFSLSYKTGMIKIKHGTQVGSYLLEFIVSEEYGYRLPTHFVSAYVNVTVNPIPAVNVQGEIKKIGRKYSSRWIFHDKLFSN